MPQEVCLTPVEDYFAVRSPSGVCAGAGVITWYVSFDEQTFDSTNMLNERNELGRTCLLPFTHWVGNG